MGRAASPASSTSSGSTLGSGLAQDGGTASRNPGRGSSTVSLRPSPAARSGAAGGAMVSRWSSGMAAVDSLSSAATGSPGLSPDMGSSVVWRAA